MSATFSLVETSMLTSRRHSLKTMASRGRRGAKAALRLLDDMDGLLGTVLLWNNFANVVVASLSTVLAVRLFGDDNYALGATNVIATVTLLICCEVSPKAIGVRFAERVACLAAPPLLLLVRLTPVGRPIRVLIDWLLAWLGKDGAGKERRRVAVGELLALIHDKDTLVEAGAGNKDPIYRMVSLHEMTMHEIMRGRAEISYLDLGEDIDQIRTRLRDSGHRLLPLCDGGLDSDILGMVDVHAAFTAANAGTFDHAWLRQAATAATFIPDTLDPASAMRRIIGSGTGLVVDEYGGLVGIVSTHDFLLHVFGEPEEGASPDEDPSIADGDMSLHEVNLRYGLSVDSAEDRTLAAFIVSSLGHYPQRPGAMVTAGGAHFEVVKLDGRHISQVRVIPAAAGDDGADGSAAAQETVETPTEPDQGR